MQAAPHVDGRQVSEGGSCWQRWFFGGVVVAVGGDYAAEGNAGHVM
jgi:hypothetical protein